MTQNQTLKPVYSAENLARRTAYAAAMGLDCWVARKPLAGAGDHSYLPLVKRSIQVPDLQGSDNPQVSENVDRKSSARKKLVEEVLKGSAFGVQPQSETTRAAFGEQQSVKGSRVETLVGESESDVADLPARFELSTSVIADALILDDMAGFTSVPSSYQKWLAALSLVLNPSRKPGSVIAPNRLKWPEAMGGIEPPRDPAGAIEAARELVQTWMLRLVNSHTRRVIIMGAVPNLLFDEAGWQQLSSQNVRLSDVQVLRTLSSVKIWESAANKRRLWSQLRGQIEH